MFFVCFLLCVFLYFYMACGRNKDCLFVSLFNNDIQIMRPLIYGPFAFCYIERRATFDLMGTRLEEPP